MPETPTTEVLKLQKEGKGDAEIIASLTTKGFTPAQISEALNQAKIKAAVSEQKEEPTGATDGLTASIMTEEAPAPSPEEGISAPAPEAAPIQEAALAPAPEGGEYYEQPVETGVDIETIEEITEEIISEKWEETKTKIDDILEWKEYNEKKLKSIEERVKRIESSLDNIQNAVIGKVKEYGENIKNLGSEMRSLEGAFSKAVPSLITKSKAKEKKASNKK